MKKRIAIVGAGAVGGYVGASLTDGGHDVVLIDPWAEHVNVLRRDGMNLYGMTPEERKTIPVNAMHLTDVQSLAKQQPIDIAFISMKSYDTVWATRMIAQYLALKDEADDCLLFFRMGDFYEMFFDDAVAAAATLDIALTRRGEHAGVPIPMCGVPVHAADAYLARLI